jgi:uncharacterized protein
MLRLVKFLLALLAVTTPTLAQTDLGISSLPGMDIDTSLSGTWTSLVDASNRTTMDRMIVTIQATTNGSCFATVDLPDRMTFSIPMSMMRCSGQTIDMASEMLNMSFTGRFSPTGRTIDGTVVFDGISSTIRLEKTSSLLVPATRSPYPEATLRIRNEDGGVVFTAICTTPDTNRAWPVIIVISDDGPDDADGSFASHRPFRDLARSLAAQQWACVRFADRGVQGSTGAEHLATIDDRVSDVLALLDRLKRLDRIDTTRIVLVGFGEGGLVAAAVAAASTSIDGTVMLHTPALDGYTAMTERIRETSATNDDASSAIALLAGWLSDVGAISDVPRLVEAISKRAAEARTSAPALAPILAGFQKANAADYITATIIPWLRSVRDLSPGPILRKVSGPVLALYAERSRTFPLLRTVETMRGILTDKPQSDVRILSGTNRRFQRCSSCTVEEESYLQDSINPTIVDVILGWAAELPDVRKKR